MSLFRRQRRRPPAPRAISRREDARRAQSKLQHYFSKSNALTPVFGRRRFCRPSECPLSRFDIWNECLSLPRSRSSLLEAYARAAVFVLLGVQKDNPSAFERASYRFHVGVSAPLWTARAFHPLYCLHGEFCRRRKILLAPIEQSSRRSDLTRCQHAVSPFVQQVTFCLP